MDLDEAYRVLEVAPGATDEEARDARKLLAKVWHPDRHANDAELQKKAERKLADINSAYKVLRDAGFPPARRQPKVASTAAELAAVARMAAARSASLDAKQTAPPVARPAAPPSADVVAAAARSAEATAKARARLEELDAEERRKSVREEARPRRRRWLVLALLVAIAAGGAYLAIAKPWVSSGAEPRSRARDESESPARAPRTIGLGASESDLRAVFGEPRSISEAFGHWEYAGGTVYVEAGRVVGWWLRDADTRRRVHLEPSDAGAAKRARAAGEFCLGSTRDEVIALEGTPDHLDPTFHNWHYGTAHVTFDERGKVTDIWPPDGRGLHACRR